jgi:hypothetical protein
MPVHRSSAARHQQPSVQHPRPLSGSDDSAGILRKASSVHTGGELVEAVHYVTTASLSRVIRISGALVDRAGP